MFVYSRENSLAGYFPVSNLSLVTYITVLNFIGSNSCKSFKIPFVNSKRVLSTNFPHAMIWSLNLDKWEILPPPSTAFILSLYVHFLLILVRKPYWMNKLLANIQNVDIRGWKSLFYKFSKFGESTIPYTDVLVLKLSNQLNETKRQVPLGKIVESEKFQIYF